MREARGRLRGAEVALAAGLGPSAVSAAYYAMLYAARAALSEEERYAKTHGGTWQLFRTTFVSTGRFDPALLRAAASRQELREAADYDARSISVEEAEVVLAEASAFVEAVARMLGADEA